MALAQQLVVLTQLLALGALAGALLGQLRASAPEVTGIAVAGAVLALLAQVARLVLDVLSGPVGWPVAVVVTLLSAVVAVLVLANRRFLSVPRGLCLVLAGLSLVIAVLGTVGQ